MRAVEALQTYAKAQEIDDQTIFALALALEECGSNIVNHALRRDASQTFQISFEKTRDVFVIELRDRGPAFDPMAIPARQPQMEEDDVPGGWGIHLVRRHINEIRYRREGDENILRLTKHLPPSLNPDNLSS